MGRVDVGCGQTVNYNEGGWTDPCGCSGVGGICEVDGAKVREMTRARMNGGNGLGRTTVAHDLGTGGGAQQKGHPLCAWGGMKT